MVAKQSTLRAAAVAEADYLMPTGPGGGQPDDGQQPFDLDPFAPGSLTRQFLTYGVDADGNTVPLKTLRITNNTAETVYPIMRDPNSNTVPGNAGVGLYDPYDPPNMEYRGYIGYKQGGKYYFGLKAGESILVSVPLVFWNGARIGIGTDGQYLTPTGPPNPLTYDPDGHRSIARAAISDDTIANGVVMWYRARIPRAPNDDTEDQLAEWTIRDHDYLIKIRTSSQIPDSQLVTLINYDVSNVDNLYLPLAMEANDVWVVPQGSGTGSNPNRDGWKPGSDPDVYGWTGAVNTVDFLQTKIRAFTADDNQLPNQILKQYFGGKGWPFYNIPNPTNDPDAPIKIPSGANIFAQSPLKAVPSSYGNGQWQNDKYMLSSGGTEPISATIPFAGGTTDQPGSTTLHLNLDDPKKIDFLGPNYLVTGFPNDPDKNPIQKDTTLVKVIDSKAGTVELSKPLVYPSANCSYQFTRPVQDYASEAMIKLWYSWAQYYLAHWKDQTPGAPIAKTPIVGSIEAMTATLAFNGVHPELVKGMAVSGPGLDKAQTERGVHQGDAVILAIASDQRSAILSQVPATGSTNATFTIEPPKSLLWTPSKGDPGYPLIGDQFVFSNEQPWHDPYTFSQQVYLIMASMNQIGQQNNDSVSKFMQDIVGANMGYIFTDDAKKTDDAQMVIAMIRDMIKSVLRGVTDFTKYPDTVDEQGNHLFWYPDPTEPHGSQPFNVFNLDPFVRFVHVNLGFSGYGFSVDDDTADVGAGGATQLRISVTQADGLQNPYPWTIQAPYGPVKDVRLSYSGPANDTNGDTLYNAIASVRDTTPITITTPAPHNLSNGAKVRIDQVAGDNAANGTFTIGNVTRTTFDLFDANTGNPVAPNGTYTGGGRWSYPLHPYVDTGRDLTEVFYRVTGDDALGTFLGTSVSVNGVSENKKVKFRVWQLGRQDSGRLLLNVDLTDASGNLLIAGTYSFTFFGIAEPPELFIANVGLDSLEINVKSPSGGKGISVKIGPQSFVEVNGPQVGPLPWTVGDANEANPQQVDSLPAIVNYGKSLTAVLYPSYN